jgi:hypothetical protein
VTRPNQSSNLETSLKALANDMAQKLVSAVLQGSLDELGGFSKRVAAPAQARAVKAPAVLAKPLAAVKAPPVKAPPVKAPKAASKATAKAAAKAAAPKGGKASAPKATAAQLARASRGEVLQALVSYLHTRPQGARAEELRSALGLPRAKFIQATRDGLSTEEIRKIGHLRSTTYFAV